MYSRKLESFTLHSHANEVKCFVLHLTCEILKDSHKEAEIKILLMKSFSYLGKFFIGHFHNFKKVLKFLFS